MSKVSDYFNQEKKGVARESSKQKHAPAPAAQAARPVAEEYTGLAAEGISPEEKVLRQFDLATRYGPCTGMTRLERWERASKLGLDPPEEVHRILAAAGAGSPYNHNIWHNRV